MMKISSAVIIGWVGRLSARLFPVVGLLSLLFPALVGRSPQGLFAAQQDAYALERLLRDFLLWQPIIPTDRKGKIDLRSLGD